jgi:hypothetical protein
MFNILGHVVFHPSIDAKELSLVVCVFHNYCMVSTIVFLKILLSPSL